MRKKTTTAQVLQPYMISEASTNPTTDVRRNAAGSIERTDRFRNIDDGLVPYRYSSSVYGSNRSSIDVRDAVVLCQKAYYNFALFRNIIDLMTEFSTSPLVLRGGTKKSRAFFNALFAQVNIWDVMDKFFREYYRSGNVFIYRFDTDVQTSDIRQMVDAFGLQAKAAGQEYGRSPGDNKNPYLSPNVVRIHPEKYEVEKMKIPARYILLNPADIQMMSTLNFAYGIYFKIMTDYEIARLRNPVSEQDVAIFKDLPKEVQEQIKSGSRVIAIPLDPTKVAMVFYKRQDYEPFAVPMGYPVLEDINFKAELRKIDMAICRTMQQIVLLVTAGAEPEKGGVNQKNLDALRKLFTNQSVGRVLIADYTTKAEFVVPSIGDLLDPKKYEIVNRDINIGLNNVFAGEDKFANQQQKVELFIARLESGRQAFLNNFLLPEMRRICESIGLRRPPAVYFEPIELRDNSTNNKIYGRLMELGILTPEQGFTALETGRLPDPQIMKEAHEEYKTDREKGLYQPLIGGGKAGQEVGRPQGTTGIPQATKNVGPIGSKAAEEEKFSVSKVKENMLLAQALEKEVASSLKQTHNIKRLNKLQKEVAASIVTQIMSNEEPSKWLEVCQAYCESPEDKNHERVSKVNRIAEAHQLDNYLASLLLASKVEHV